MKKYIYQLVILSGLALAAGSCSKAKLNPSSSTGLSDASVFQTKGRIANQVNGLYAAVRSGQFMGGRVPIYNDIRGENFINETGNGVTGLLIWNFTVGGGDTYINNTWNAAYLCINQCNLFLDGMEATGNKVVGDDLAKKYNAEAKFVRALAYYNLLQLYATPYTKDNGASPGLPLRLKGIKGSGFSNLARSTVAEVYNQIISDLNDAESGLPADYGDDATNVVHAHVNTAIALKTRVYLSMGNYDNVITEASKIVPAAAPFKAPSGVANALVSDLGTVFTSYMTAESIFSLPYTGAAEAPAGQSQLGSYYLPPKDYSSQGSGEYSLNAATGVITDANWKATDVRRNYIFTDTKGKKWWTKFSSPSPYLDWVPILRYSEVMLSLAEARTRKANAVDAQAVALLNAVRQRSDATTTFAPASATELINDILQERNIEFLGEGLRSIDIIRLQQTFPAKGAAVAVAPTSQNYMFPAPSSETAVNTLW
ncbi:RagB/SusD family nutrient uptake outer membrane protein [Flavitalea sp. BT771]|uniref:RagB/SusD family nutrient uptake outer membrane protein n=1 Tax=Flavitalea sp. BT771 TaxID=3063329 RepID=UPI0026E28392|nr:RagB/SusD family nutrient uptake outer membrane protein [Flavitalea sp. BT771]MDO6429720.1 RagB/SusD family nutrient uptake outer membrane protein [Flavitalea sp. BT771]MDV6218152.1 RagB/SusD family nutrient uptake outer membrane protein [Flavitalea sp. BT771]